MTATAAEALGVGDDFDIEAALARSRDFVTALEQRIDQQRDVVTAQALQVNDAFWDAVKATREESGDKLRGYYGLRVRRRGNALEIVWFRNKTYNTKEGRKTFPDSIPKGLQHRYSSRSFKGAQPWERSMIEETEEQCAPLRRQWELLSRLAHTVREYRKVISEQG